MDSMRVSPLITPVVATMNLIPLTFPRNLRAAISAKVTPPRKKTRTEAPLDGMEAPDEEEVLGAAPLLRAETALSLAE